MNSLIWILLLWSLLECFFKGISVYEVFIQGVKEGFMLISTIFPVLLVLTLWVNLMQSCGIMELLEKMFVHLQQWFQIPLDIFVMCFIRPVSSQGAMIILKSIYERFGVDHSFSILASIIQTGSDTTLYVVSLYYGSIHLKKYSYTLWLGFFLDFLSFVFMLCFYAFFGASRVFPAG